MPIIVDIGCVRIAKLMKDNFEFWIGLGRTTPWDNDDNPPQETSSVDIISDICGLRKAEIVSFVVPDAAGDIVFRGARYRRVNDNEIYSVKSRWLYIATWFEFDLFPLVTFRQTAVFVDVIPRVGFEGYKMLLPNQIQSYGIMLGYINHYPRKRVFYGKDVVELILDVEGKLTLL